jgi:proteic killer suppression protein
MRSGCSQGAVLREEKLSGNRAGRHSIRINDQWRICFEWREGDAYQVEIVDYH